MDHKFAENNEGVHLMNGEFTLCGDAFDIGTVTDEVEEVRETERRVVTCERCKALILYCRGVRVKL